MKREGTRIQNIPENTRQDEAWIEGISFNNKRKSRHKDKQRIKKVGHFLPIVFILKIAGGITCLQ